MKTVNCERISRATNSGPARREAQGQIQGFIARSCNRVGGGFWRGGGGGVPEKWKKVEVTLHVLLGSSGRREVDDFKKTPRDPGSLNLYLRERDCRTGAGPGAFPLKDLKKKEGMGGPDQLYFFRLEIRSSRQDGSGGRTEEKNFSEKDLGKILKHGGSIRSCLLPEMSDQLVRAE